MKRVIINDFLKHGSSRGWEIGLPIEKFMTMATAMGQETEPYSQDEFSVFFDIDQYEISFYEGKLNAVKLRLHQNDGIEYFIKTDDTENRVSHQTKLSDFVAILNSAGIEWKLAEVNAGKDLYILTEGNVIVIYSFADQEEELVHITKTRGYQKSFI